jgi:hypothetical protein
MEAGMGATAILAAVPAQSLEAGLLHHLALAEALLAMVRAQPIRRQP